MDNERWVTVDDVAAHLGVARDSVYRWLNTKDLPAHRVGRAWRFRLSEIDDWVRSSRGVGMENKIPDQRTHER
jgi:excisionase family DNA binding protein